MSESALLRRQLERERAARVEAETLLQNKMAELSKALREAELARDRLYAQAYSDPLTGLANRRQLETQFEQLDALNQRDAEINIGLILIDLDGFKPINDQHGHEAGDWVLHQIAQRLTVAARPTDCVARIGGDEFVIMCPQVHEFNDVAQIAERIREYINQPVQVGEGEQSLSASIGYSYGEREATLGQLLREADEAMYVAKRAGKNQALPFRLAQSA